MKLDTLKESGEVKKIRGVDEENHPTTLIDNPDGYIHWDGDLSLTYKKDNEGFTTIPKNIIVTRRLNAIGNPSLEKINSYLNVKEWADFSKCEKLKVVEGPISVRLFLKFTGCSSLESLPQVINATSLYLMSCPKLKTMPVNPRWTSGPTSDNISIVFDDKTGLSIWQLLSANPSQLYYYRGEFDSSNGIGNAIDLSPLCHKVEAEDLDVDDPMDKLDIAEVLYDMGLGNLATS